MTVTRQGEQADVVLQLFDKDGTEHRLVLTAEQARQAKAELAELADELAAAPDEELTGEAEELTPGAGHESSTGWPPPKA